MLFATFLSQNRQFAQWVGLGFIWGQFSVYLGFVYDYLGLVQGLFRVGLASIQSWSMVCFASFRLDRLDGEDKQDKMRSDKTR